MAATEPGQAYKIQVKTSIPFKTPKGADWNLKRSCGSSEYRLLNFAKKACVPVLRCLIFPGVRFLVA
ncbi:hypothetical protein IscW_ISCW010861 [Ixodes scapularis]|uniref:Uncharacterized protein n=1 Tax=Ixodes scapularis TaxID=6945 RepID=B7Q7G7_IXOSC|nr:hypothetical protein IscW_ISCW010861 [Ixodes scapularis]|eukprot:XP_002403991.1 hypothetical protein IscW_ISCW010861 [Ixodes scapularis]